MQAHVSHVALLLLDGTLRLSGCRAVGGTARQPDSQSAVAQSTQRCRGGVPHTQKTLAPRLGAAPTLNSGPENAGTPNAQDASGRAGSAGHPFSVSQLVWLSHYPMD